MCLARDCRNGRAHELDPCPVYFALRDALFPAGADVPGVASLALFWLAREVGAEEINARASRLQDLVALFTFAQISESERAATAARAARAAVISEAGEP